MDTGSLAKSYNAKWNNSQRCRTVLFCVKRCLWELASELGMLEKFVLGSYQLRVIRLYWRDGIPFSLWLLQGSWVTRMNGWVDDDMGEKKGWEVAWITWRSTVIRLGRSLPNMRSWDRLPRLRNFIKDQCLGRNLGERKCWWQVGDSLGQEIVLVAEQS